MRYDFPMIVHVACVRTWWMLLKYVLTIRSFFLCWLFGITYRKLPKFSGGTIIRTRRRGEIELGVGVEFNADCKRNLVGLTGPTILDTLAGGRIKIGDRSGFSSVVMSSRTMITIGARCKCGGNVRIFDHDYHSLSPEDRADYAKDFANVRSAPIVIGNDVFIGTNAIILKGSRVGAGAIVAAGAVVFGLEIPPMSIVKGNPAVVVSRKG